MAQRIINFDKENLEFLQAQSTKHGITMTKIVNNLVHFKMACERAGVNHEKDADELIMLRKFKSDFDTFKMMINEGK